MAKLKSPEGDLVALRAKECKSFFGRSFKECGPFRSDPPVPMNKPLIARDMREGMPKGADTVGGVVGGLKDSSDFQGMRAGMPPRSK